jgi:hypothetical protein
VAVSSTFRGKGKGNAKKFAGNPKAAVGAYRPLSLHLTKGKKSYVSELKDFASSKVRSLTGNE